ncbi:MAG TPA: ester cyclase [Methanoregulaceae archaeon]|nr:ester cyclase [Methanolinea sp.]HPD11147.1 ester cyclase [Methanoregulaceae archaeon]HRU80675.1 ester cyclase [Methanolinea sp.]
MTVSKNKEIVREFFEKGPSGGDIAAADALLAPEFSLHVPLPVSGPGTEAINAVIISCRAAFGGLHVTIEDMIAEEDKVTCRFTARGVHHGEFMGVPPTGKEIMMTGIEIFRIKNGKIAELWGEANLMGLAQQLGIVPAPA